MKRTASIIWTVSLVILLIIELVFSLMSCGPNLDNLEKYTYDTPSQGTIPIVDQLTPPAETPPTNLTEAEKAVLDTLPLVVIVVVIVGVFISIVRSTGE